MQQCCIYATLFYHHKRNFGQIEKLFVQTSSGVVVVVENKWLISTLLEGVYQEVK